MFKIEPIAMIYLSVRTMFAPLTQAILELHLPNVIATLVHQYVIDAFDDLSAGIAGHGELCDRRSSSRFRISMGVCQGNHRELIDQMISKHQLDPKSGLFGACRGGHRELVEEMISYGARAWNGALVEACRGGHIEIANMMIVRGASDFDIGLSAACDGGHRELSALLLVYGGHPNSGLYSACRADQMECVRLMIANGATHCLSCYKNANEHPQ